MVSAQSGHALLPRCCRIPSADWQLNSLPNGLESVRLNRGPALGVLIGAESAILTTPTKVLLRCGCGIFVEPFGRQLSLVPRQEAKSLANATAVLGQNNCAINAQDDGTVISDEQAWSSSAAENFKSLTSATAIFLCHKLVARASPQRLALTQMTLSLHPGFACFNPSGNSRCGGSGSFACAKAFLKSTKAICQFSMTPKVKST